MALLSFLVLAFSAGLLFKYAETKGPSSSSESVIITIPHRSTSSQIRHILARSGLIHDDIRFLILARLTGYSHTFQAGEFRIATGLKPLELMRKLSEARPVQHPVTIPEGLKAEEIAGIFAKGEWCDKDVFMHLVHNSGFIASLGLENVSSLEGYLYPDTYYLTRMSTNARSIIQTMVQRFQTVWQELIEKGTGSLSARETVILASIVEKETADATERPMIAAVFLNRLKLGMRLQSDPTVIYGIKNFSGNLVKSDLQRYTPYNTYLIPGLPIGPICNPGKDSLDAVLHPVKEPFLYFVSKNDGTHKFSKTLSEHNRAVWKYQKRKLLHKKKK